MRAQVQSLCGCGCGAPVRIAARDDRVNGYTEGEPRQFIHGHNSRRSVEPYIVDENGCWVWQRSFWKSGGRPRLKRAGKWVAAYRDYYERLVGPVPDGLTLDHLCENFKCVNPAHLEPVTLEENQRRAGLIRLTDEQRQAVAQSTGPQGPVAVEYGISTAYVSTLRKGLEPATPVLYREGAGR